MNKSTDPIVLADSKEAASIKTVTGWVSRHGNYFGDDERIARYDGSTHKRCECGNIAPRGHTKCKECYAADEVDAWKRLPRVKWDGKVALYSHKADRYFWDDRELADYCEDEEIAVHDLMLVVCVPRFAFELEPYDIYENELPIDGGEVPDVLDMAFDVLNKAIRECKEPLSWELGETVPDDESLICPTENKEE